MFNKLPFMTKKMIFARVRLMDLYEVCGVSQEWWTITMATCRPTSDKYSHFFKFQVRFCNKVMPKEEGWKDWMFVEFTDDKSIALDGPKNEEMVEYLRRNDIHVRKLIYRGDASILTNLDTLFPYLKVLDCTLDSYKYEGKAIVLRDWLKRLHLTIRNTTSEFSLIDVFKNLERVTALHISSSQRILFNGISFDELKILHLNMRKQSTEDIKSLVNRSEQLSIVHVKYGSIDKEWLGLFPTTIKEVHLIYMRLDEAIVPLLGTADALVERQLMRFVCQDWTQIRLFKCLSDHFDCHKYVCRPQLPEEKLAIIMEATESPSCLLDSGKLQLKVLKVFDDRDTKSVSNIIVPKSVQHFELRANNFDAINFAQLFEDISTIEKLRIHSYDNEKILFSDFPNAVNLVSLDISSVDDTFLASILSNCPSLKQLSLDCQQGMPFSKLPPELKSPSVKQLRIIEPKDSISNILGHFPCLVDLHVKEVHMLTVETADLAQLTTLEFVRIIFYKAKNLFTLKKVVDCLDQLSFSDDDSHLILGYSPKKPWGNEILSCVMGKREAFYRRYLSSNSKNDFIEMNIQHLSDCFIFGRDFYLKGVSSKHLGSLSESIRITYDLQEFLANSSAA